MSKIQGYILNTKLNPRSPFVVIHQSVHQVLQSYLPECGDSILMCEINVEQIPHTTINEHNYPILVWLSLMDKHNTISNAPYSDSKALLDKLLNNFNVIVPADTIIIAPEMSGINAYIFLQFIANAINIDSITNMLNTNASCIVVPKTIFDLYDIKTHEIDVTTEQIEQTRELFAKQKQNIDKTNSGFATQNLRSILRHPERVDLSSPLQLSL